MTAERDIADFTKKLQRAIDRATAKGRDIIGNIVVEIIQKRTRSGYGVRNGAKVKLKPLSKSYIRYRKRNRARLSNFASPGKSNLTFTGQMLAGLKHQKSAKGVVITFDTQRNRNVARHVQKARPFLDLTRKEVDQVANVFEKYFSTLVKREFR